MPSILALGDVTGGPELTPVALEEAMKLVEHHFGDSTPESLDYERVATAVFCHPTSVPLVSRKRRPVSVSRQFASTVPTSVP